MRRFEIPIRVIGLSNQGIPLFNFLAYVDEFSWGMDRSDNIHYEIELNEAPERIRDSARRYGDIWENVTEKQKREDLLDRLRLAIRNL